MKIDRSQARRVRVLCESRVVFDVVSELVENLCDENDIADEVRYSLVSEFDVSEDEAALFVVKLLEIIL